MIHSWQLHWRLPCELYRDWQTWCVGSRPCRNIHGPFKFT